MPDYQEIKKEIEKKKRESVDLKVNLKQNQCGEAWGKRSDLRGEE